MGEAYSGLNRERVEIPAFSLASVEFFDVKPNYFRVTNQGDGKIYCATSRIPTESIYDFVCDGQAIQLHADPHPRNKLYIFNPNGSAVSVDVMSFYAPFEPLALAFSSIRLDFSGTTLETSTAIDSFKTSLPAGNNKIGTVGISGSLPAGENKIGNVEITNLPDDYAKAENQKDYTEVLNEIGSLLDNFTARRYNTFRSGIATADGETLTASDGYRWCEIMFLSNDGENEIIVSTIDTDGRTNSINIKSGEVLNHITCRCPNIKITGAGAYRLALLEMGA